jgi:hypothetical protein
MTPMATFFRRAIRALMLDAGVFEEVEADRSADWQSLTIVLMVCLASGVAAFSLGTAGLGGFVTGAVIALGGWVVWAAAIAALGTMPLAEPQTRSDLHELLRVLGFAAVPGVFVAFAGMPAIAPLVLGGVAIWMIAAAALAVRQALDYRSTIRAVAVCVLAWALSFGAILIALLVTSQSVT